MSYKFRDDIARADVAYDVRAPVLEELFVDAGLALEATQVGDLGAVEQGTEKRIEVGGDDVEEVMFNFLQELIFLKDAELLLFSKFRAEKVSSTGAVIVACGEKLDMEKHELKVDVKAVTYHMFEVVEDGDGWRATVVLDV